MTSWGADMVGGGRQLRRCCRKRRLKWKCTDLSVEVILLESERGSRKFRSLARFVWRPRVQRSSRYGSESGHIRLVHHHFLDVLYLSQGQPSLELEDLIQRHHAQTLSGRSFLATRSPERKRRDLVSTHIIGHRLLLRRSRWTRRMLRAFTWGYVPLQATVRA